MATLMIIFACFVCMSALTGRRSRCGRRRRELGDRPEADELGRITELLTDMTVRMDRPEEERDFYRELMGSEVSFGRVIPAGEDVRPGEPPRG